MTVLFATRSRHDPRLEALASSDPARASAAKEALIADVARAVPLLVSCLDEDDDQLRLRAISLLGLIGDARAARPLASLLHDPAPLVRQRAAGALTRVSGPETVTVLGRLIAREPEVKVRLVAVRALVRLLQTGHDSASAALLERLADDAEDARVRRAAMGALPWLARLDDAAPVSALLDRLERDPCGDVARCARRMRARHARPRLEPWAMNRLLADLASPRLRVWRRAIAHLGPAGSAAIEPLIEAMAARPHDREYARRAVLLLKEMSPRQLARLGGLLESVREPVPLEALVEVAGHAGGRAVVVRLAGLLESLATAERDGPGQLHGARLKAHVALAQSGSRLAVKDLRLLLEDRRFPVRPDLVQAAAIVGTRCELPALLSAYRRSRGMTRLAVRDAVLAVLRRERIRRTDRSLMSLEPADRRAALEILGLPRPAQRRALLPGSRVDRAASALLT